MWWRVRRRACSSPPSRRRAARRSGPRYEVEGAHRRRSRDPQGLGLPRRPRQPREVADGEVEIRGRRDHLDRPRRGGLESRAEDLVPADDLPERSGEGGRIEPAGEAHRRRHVVGHVPRRELVEEPEPLLGEGEARRALALAKRAGERRRGSGRAAGGFGRARPLHRRRQTRDGGRREELAERDLDAERLAEPGEDLGGEERVATQVEEVVADRDRGNPQHLRPGRRHQLLDGRTRQGGLPGLRPPRPDAGRPWSCPRQGPAVELAARGERQSVQEDIGGGEHRLRKAAGEVTADVPQEGLRPAPLRLRRGWRGRDRGRALPRKNVQPPGVDVPERCPGQGRILLALDREAVPGEQGDDPRQPAAQVVDLGHHLPNLPPVGLVEPGEHLQLAFLGIDFEQVDPRHPLFPDHRGEGAHPAGHPLAPQPLVEDLVGLSPRHLPAPIEKRADDLPVLAAGMAPGEEGRVRVVGQLGLPRRLAQGAVEEPGFHAVEGGVGGEGSEDRRDGLEGVDGDPRRLAGGEEGEEADVRPDVEHPVAGADRDPVAQIAAPGEDLAVEELGLAVVSLYDRGAVGEV